MRRFYVKLKNDETIIYELDVKIVTALEDPSVMWLKPGEYKAHVLKPEAFYMKVEKVVEGKKVTTMVPDIWYSHCLHEEYDDAIKEAHRLIEHEAAFKMRHHKPVFTDAEIEAASAAIETAKSLIRVEKLPGSDFLTDADRLKLRVEEP